MSKILVLFYSTYGHMYKLAMAAAKGVEEAGSKVTIKRVAETLPKEVLEKMYALEAQKQFAHVPIAEPAELSQYDGIIFAMPTRFGSIPSQMKTFIDATGQLWMSGALRNKVGSVMVSSATQHGGQEMTFSTMHTIMLHHGMVVVGLSGVDMGNVDTVTGGSPYGATTVTGSSGQRMPTESELKFAQAQGKNVAELAKKLWS